MYAPAALLASAGVFMLFSLMGAQEISVGRAGLKFFYIALGAALGSFVAGRAADRFFALGRPPVICCLLVLLGLMTLV